MLNELSERELGVGFIYSILELFAERHGLSDVGGGARQRDFGTQMFRLGWRGGHPGRWRRTSKASPGVYCEPDTVPRGRVRRRAHAPASSRCRCTSRASAPRTTRSPTSRTGAASTRRSKSRPRAAPATAGPSRWCWSTSTTSRPSTTSSGHEFGNHLLRQFGFALRQAVRQGDTAARIGGDEFAVILSNAEGHESSGFTERLKGHLVALGNPVEFTIGTATSPRDSTDPGELLRMADGRLYEKKGIRIS